MQRRRGVRTSRLSIPAAAAGLASLLLAGCGLVDSSDEGAPPSADPVAADIDCARQGKVPGSGSTAQDNAMKYWIKQYERACHRVRIAYNPLGSGAGVVQFMQGTTAFGGTDSAVDPDENTPDDSVCTGGRVINLPMVGGAIALGYNVTGVDDLVLDAATIARIFDARITQWDDPAIRKLNPGAELPSLPIRAVHRQDGSGTTQNFQAYLADAAPEVWQHPAEKSWQGRGGEAADGSSAVASAVAETPGSIGHFELSFAAAQRLKAVRVDTGAAEPVAATAETASAGIAARPEVVPDLHRQRRGAEAAVQDSLCAASGLRRL